MENKHFSSLDQPQNLKINYGAVLQFLLMVHLSIFAVDAHFSRSLGSAAWKEIQRVASINKEKSQPASPTSNHNSGQDVSNPPTTNNSEGEREVKDMDEETSKEEPISP
jgi:hypothetical protein